MKRVLVLFAVGVIAATTACSSNKTATPPPASSSPATGAISVVLKDFSLSVTPEATSAGSVVFTITNQGPTTHEFVIFKSDLERAALPLIADGTAVNEDGAGVTHITEKENIAKDATTTLSATLQPGKYVLICNLPTHYKLGMNASFTVSS